MTVELSDTDLKIAWKWLVVTTSFEKMMACPTQKAILVAIARNMKNDKKKECYDYSKRRFTD